MAALLPPSGSAPSPGFVALAVLPLMGVALLVAGLLGLVSFVVLPLAGVVHLRDSVPAPGVVEAVSISPPASPIHPPLDALQIRYRYAYGGIDYVGTRYDVHDGRFPRGTAAETAAALKAAPAVTVWLDPRTPQRAVIRPRLRSSVLQFAFPAALMLVGGAILVYGGMLAWSRNRPGAGARSARGG